LTFAGLFGGTLTLTGDRLEIVDSEGSARSVALTTGEREQARRGENLQLRLADGGLLVLWHMAPRDYCPRETLTVLIEEAGAIPGGPLAHEQVSVEFPLDQAARVLASL
jgi:hypothetical protein